MQLYIPDTLLQLHPNLSKNQIRAIVKTIWNYKSAKLKTGHVIDFKIVHFGRIKSHGNKKKKKYLSTDRRKKKRKYNRLLMTKEKLLF